MMTRLNEYVQTGRTLERKVNDLKVTPGFYKLHPCCIDESM